VHAIPATIAAIARSRSSSAGAPWKPSGYSSAMNPVVSSPARNRGCCISARGNRRCARALDLEPVERRDLQVRRRSRVGAQVISLAIIGS
jgi:hypothetical protein